MLILTRKPGESLYIGDSVKVTIVEIKGHQIRVGIDAPADLRIYREEIYLQILEENRQAAKASEAGLEGLAEVWKEKRFDTAPQESGVLSSKPASRPLTSLKAMKPQEGGQGKVVVKRRKTDNS